MSLLKRKGEDAYLEPGQCVRRLADSWGCREAHPGASAPVPAHMRTQPCPLQGGSRPLLGRDLACSQRVIPAASSFPCALEAQRKIHSARQPFRYWRERHWGSSEHPSSSLQLSPVLAALPHPSCLLQLHHAVPSVCQHRFRI